MQKVHTTISAARWVLNLKDLLLFFFSILFFKVLFIVPSRYFTLLLNLSIFSLAGGPAFFEQKIVSYTLFYSRVNPELGQPLKNKNHRNITWLVNRSYTRLRFIPQLKNLAPNYTTNVKVRSPLLVNSRLILIPGHATKMFQLAPFFFTTKLVKTVNFTVCFWFLVIK